MRKKVGIIKRLFCLLLIFLLSINSFAAIVSDNDGSAFITKAEFDALKSSFQSQIDSYNQSIDSKIDGAIASYLAGIRLSSQIEQALFLPVSSGSSLVIKCVHTGSLKKNEQYFNGGSFAAVKTGTMSNSLGTNLTYGETTWYQEASLAKNDGKGQAFILSSQPGKYDVVSKYAKKAMLNMAGGINIVLNWASAYEMNYMRKGLFTGKKINEVVRTSNSTKNSGIFRFLAHMRTNGGITAETVDPGDWPYKDVNDDGTGLAVFRNCITGGKITDSDSRSNHLYYLPSEVTLTKEEADYDDTIYLFDKCDEKIYCYNEADEFIEEYEESVYNTSTDTATKYQRYAVVPVDHPSLEGQSSYWDRAWSACYYFPHYRIKQSFAGTVYSNLNQLKNGKLPYGSDYARYYEGLPLFQASGDGVGKLTVKIIDPTGTFSSTKARIWIKKGAFSNNTTVPTSEQDDLIDFKVGSTTQNYIDIPLNTLTVLEFVGVKKQEKYFLKFAESGKTYGGQLVQLSDCILTVEN